MNYRFIFLLVCAGLMSSAIAAKGDDAKVKKLLSAMVPNAKYDSLRPSGIPGLYEAVYGSQIYYVSADGQYLIEGDLYRIKIKKGRAIVANLTEKKREGGRAKAITSIDEASLIKFTPENGKAKYIVTAFTDIDCGYCRKLHGQMADYNKLGIEMRYAAYPRSGVNTDSYFKAQAVWCAVDRNKAMNFAKSGATLKQLKSLPKVKDSACGKAIAEHMKVAQQVGVSGTPTLVMESGQVLPGYVPPNRIIKILQAAELSKNK